MGDGAEEAVSVDSGPRGRNFGCAVSVAAPIIAVSATILSVLAVRRGLLPVVFALFAYWGGCLLAFCVPVAAVMISRDPIWVRLFGAALAGIAGLALWWFCLVIGGQFL